MSGLDLIKGSCRKWNSRDFPQTDLESKPHSSQENHQDPSVAHNLALSIYNVHMQNKALRMQDTTCMSHMNPFHYSHTVFFLFFYIPKDFQKGFSDEPTTTSSVTHTCSPHKIPQMHLSSSYTWSSFYSLFHHRRLRWWMPFYVTAFFFPLFTVSPDFTLMCEFHCCTQKLKL